MAWNDILNNDWYSRLQKKILESTSKNALATGARADDPYLMAKQNTGLSDLSKERKSAMSNLWGNMGAMNANSNAIDEQWNRRGSYGLANMQQNWVSTPLGVQPSEDAGMGPGSENIPTGSPLQAPVTSGQAYQAPGDYSNVKLPQSGGAGGVVQNPVGGYNSAMFNSPMLNKKKSKLDENMYNIMQSRNPVYGR